MWYYFKTVIKRNGSVPQRSRKAKRLWTVSSYETGYCIGRTHTFKKALNLSTNWQRQEQKKIPQ